MLLSLHFYKVRTISSSFRMPTASALRPTLSRDSLWTFSCSELGCWLSNYRQFSAVALRHISCVCCGCLYSKDVPAIQWVIVQAHFCASGLFITFNPIPSFHLLPVPHPVNPPESTAHMGAHKQTVASCHQALPYRYPHIAGMPNCPSTMRNWGTS